MEQRTTTGPSGPAQLGAKRYLYFAFLAAGALAAWIVARVVAYAWGLYGNPNDLMVFGVAGAVGFIGAIVAYRNPVVNTLATETLGELGKVTWPTRKETTAATIVVIVVSVIAAIVLGVYDAFWSWLTDLIYVT